MSVKRNAGRIAILALPFGVLGAIVVETIDIWLKLGTQDSTDDAGHAIPAMNDLRLPLIYATLRVLKPVTPGQVAAAVTFAQALMIIAQTENSRAANGAPVGDTDPSKAPQGPSISPWQLERGNAESLGLFSASDGTSGSGASQAARDEYAALAEGESGDIGLYAHALRAALFFNSPGNWPDANGDLATALKLWNGGPKALASGVSDTYAARGVAAGTANGWAVA